METQLTIFIFSYPLQFSENCCSSTKSRATAPSAGPDSGVPKFETFETSLAASSARHEANTQTTSSNLPSKKVLKRPHSDENGGEHFHKKSIKVEYCNYTVAIATDFILLYSESCRFH